MFGSGWWTKYPFGCRFVLWIAGPVAVVVAFLYGALHLSLPLESGELKVAGLRHTVVIQRDPHSIPSIAANSDHEAYFALGFVHAQDRLWQMEMNRRIGAGRLSEVLGESALGSDVATLRMGLYANAQKIWAHLDAADRTVLNNYVEGVNSGMAALSVLPIEFQILRYQPERWRAEDSLVLMQMMAWQYSGNLAAEINRMLLIRNYGPATAEMLMPGVPKEVIKTASLTSVDALTRKLAIGLNAGFFGSPEKLIGSNAWVVSGQHTIGRAPLLVNDPHLTTPIPALWYLANIRGAELDVSGATMPGLPFVLIGKNKYIAWGLTNAMADTQDVVLEEINPVNKDQYLADGKYLDMDVVNVEVHVRSGFLRPPRKPERITVRRTRNGPLLSDLADPLGKTSFSVRWTGDDDQGGTFASFLSMNYAKNWAEFNQALSSFVTPIHVFMYADRTGNIGSVAPGLYPIRESGDGSIPTSRKTAGRIWSAFIPFAEVPRSLNPVEGFIVTANNKLVTDRYPYHISSDWAPAYRADRIRDELERMIRATSGKLTAKQMMLLQQDVTSPIIANGVLRAMRSLAPQNAAQKRALSLLETWDGKMTEDSRAATLTASWLSQLNIMLLEKVKQSGARSLGGEDPLSAMMLTDNAKFLETVLGGRNQAWCSGFRAAGDGLCSGLLSASLDRSIAELGALLGTNEQGWVWRRVHQTQFAHFPFSPAQFAPGMPHVEESTIVSFFDRSTASAGGNDTVNVGPVSFDKKIKYKQLFGAMYREVIDLAGGADSYFMQGTGQSGNPVSPHYDDLIDPHQQGQYIKMGTSQPASVLLLKPSTPK